MLIFIFITLWILFIRNCELYILKVFLINLVKFYYNRLKWTNDYVNIKYRKYLVAGCLPSIPQGKGVR